MKLGTERLEAGEKSSICNLGRRDDSRGTATESVLLGVSTYVASMEMLSPPRLLYFRSKQLQMQIEECFINSSTAIKWIMFGHSSSLWMRN